MNRFEEIRDRAERFVARTVPEPDRGAATDELVQLIGLVILAVGKSVAIAGESDLNGVDFDADPEEATQYHTIYLTGERIQDGVRETTERVNRKD